MDKHVDVISILWIVSGSLGILLAIFLFWLLWGITFIPNMEYEATYILRLVATWVSIFLAVFSAPEVIGGIGLLKRREWGRILVLVVSFFNLINFPLGTALGVYSFIILLKEETVKLFTSNKK
ncbi:MAG: hypothetical protein GTO16_02825 [Candidatus Aminicenantes bacterium]|nr:hypothetical protein [Candidatus Aminicenantes bacterium]